MVTLIIVFCILLKSTISHYEFPQLGNLAADEHLGYFLLCSGFSQQFFQWKYVLIFLAKHVVLVGPYDKSVFSTLYDIATLVFFFFFNQLVN